MTKKEKNKYLENPKEFIKDYRIGYNSISKKVELLPILDFEGGNINAAHMNKNSIFVKSRQMHFTSLFAAYVAWFILFNSNKNVLVVCPTSSSACNFLDKVKIILQNYLGDNWKENFETTNLTQLELKNGCFVKAVGSSSTAIIGFRIDLLLVDEASFVEDLENIWMAANLALELKNGKCIMYSSVNYDDDFFIKLYNEAKLKKNNFVPVIRKWSDNPLRDLSYYDNIVLRIGIEHVKTELDCIPKSRIVKTELDCIPKSRIVKPTIITFRVDDWMEKEIAKKLLKKSEELRENYNISTYIRELILKDLAS